MDSPEPPVRASHGDEATFHAHGTGQYISTGNSSQHIYQNTGNGTMTNIGSIVGGAVFNSGSYAHSSLHPVASYISRLSLEKRLANELQSPHDTNSRQEMRTVVVWGLGGVGKSQLVLNYVREHQKQYQAVFWVQAGQRETIARDYIQIYKQLYPGSGDGQTTATTSADDAIVSVKTWLQRQDRRCLWVMDSADDVEDDNSNDYIDLHHYLPSGPHLDRVITTRSSTAQEFSSQDAIEVNEMAEGEAIALFQQCAGASIQSQHNEDDVRKIVRELGCLALAVTLAGSYVREDPEMAVDLNKYLAAIRQRRVEILKQKPHRLVHQYGESLLSTWEISFNMVQRQSPVAARLLNVLAFLHFDDVFTDLLIERSKPPDRYKPDSNEYDDRPGRTRLRDRFRRLFQGQQRLSHAHGEGGLPQRASWVQLVSFGACENTVTSDTIKMALKMLQRYSLISLQRGQHAYSVHKLVHSWSLHRLPAEERRTWSLAVLGLLASMIDDHKGDLSIEQRLVPHVMANFAAISAACGPTYQTTKKERHSIWTVTYLLYRIGRWSDQLNVQQYLLQVTRLALGAEHPNTLMIMNELALVLTTQGEYKQAAEMHRQTLSLRQKTLGSEHRSTLASMNNLAHVFSEQGKYEQAAEIYSQTLKLAQRVFGPEDLVTLTSTNNLATMLANQGEYAQAAEMYRQILKIQQKVFGPQHPDTLMSMNNLASVLRDQGEYEQAVEIHRQTLTLNQKILGPEHPNTILSISNLAHVLSAQGKYEQAIEMFRQVLNLKQKILGLENPSTLASMNDLAYILSYQSEDKQREATELYQRTLELRQKVLGPEHPDTLLSMNDLAFTLSEQGEDEQAEAVAIHRETIKLRQKVLGPEHPATLVSMNGLAEVLSEQGEEQQKEAIVIYRENAKLRQKALGPEHPDTLVSMNNLADILSEQGEEQQKEAIVIYRENVKLRQKALGPEHPDTLMSMNDLAYALCERTDEGQQEGVAIYREIMEVRQRVLGPEHPDTLASMSIFAHVLGQEAEEQQQEEEAIALSRETVKLCQKALGREDSLTLASMDVLAELLERRGEHEEAQQLKQSVLKSSEK